MQKYIHGLVYTQALMPLWDNSQQTRMDLCILPLEMLIRLQDEIFHIESYKLYAENWNTFAERISLFPEMESL